MILRPDDLENGNDTIIARLDRLVDTLRGRQMRYTRKSILFWKLILIPIILATALFIFQRTTYIYIIVALIALVGTLIAYVQVYYQRGIDITEDKIDAITNEKKELEINPSRKPQEECFEKLEKIML